VPLTFANTCFAVDQELDVFIKGVPLDQDPPILAFIGIIIS
jgi:hypothetical protein